MQNFVLNVIHINNYVRDIQKCRYKNYKTNINSFIHINNADQSVARHTKGKVYFPGENKVQPFTAAVDSPSFTQL